jgi:hypothetical protein
MSKLQGEVLTLPKVSGSVSATKSLSGNVGAKTINIGGKGDDGATFIPSVSADGVISWTNDKELPNPEPVNIKGAKGDIGLSGKDGYTPIKGVDYFDGQPGKDGANGKDGKNGVDGYTPQKGIDYFDGKNGADGRTPEKGVDYFTADDKAEMVAAVIAALPVYDGEVVSV